MSKEEILEEIRRLFVKLTEGEPSPDDEIEARDILIESFKILRDEEMIPNKTILVSDTLNKLESWDTLELWFKEVDGLAGNIETILKLKEDFESSQKVEPPEIIDDITGSVIRGANVDISEVVAQVTEQFKGEIDNLKETIEGLKKELHSKDEILKEPSQETSMQDEIAEDISTQDIGSNLKGKLAPPKIRIPQIKTPQKSLKIKASIEPEEEEVKPVNESHVDEIEPINVENDLKIAEKSMKPPINSNISQITLEALKEMLEPPEEPEAIVEAQEKPKFTPIITEEPSMVSKSEIPFELSLETANEKQTESKEIALTPLPNEKPMMSIGVTEESEFTPIPMKKTELLEESIEPLEEITEVPSLTPMPSDMLESDEDVIEETPQEVKEESMPEPEEVESFKNEAKSKFASLISEKPKITPIKVEEIETDSIKSSTSDLFNVFSTLGTKTGEKITHPSKSVEIEHSKEKKKKAEKKKKSAEPTKPVKSTPPVKVESTIIKEVDIDSLPMNKETLYQELIALEGRRYSLEKGYKGLSDSYESGKIDEYEFTNQSAALKENLDEIGTQIAKIRGLISSL